MKKNILLLGIIIIVLFLSRQVFAKKPLLTIAYCPTMLDYVEPLSKNNQVKLMAYQSSQEVLARLARQEIDYAVIGRKAKAFELGADFAVQQFDETATTLVKAIGSDDDEAFLIPWSEVDYAQIELVIITDELGQKLAAHRTPFLYYSNQIEQSELEKIIQLIGKKI